MSDSPGRMLLRLAPMIYGPTALFAIGEAAVVPIIPVIASALGADIATTALISSMLLVGQLCGNLPAGYLVSRTSERTTMIVAGFFALGSVIAFTLAPSLAILAVSLFLIGLCRAAFALARHAFMTIRIPMYFRARSLALLGGSLRFGLFLGPFSSAFLISLTGTTASVGWFFAVCVAITIVLVTFGPDPETHAAARVVDPLRTSNVRVSEGSDADEQEVREDSSGSTTQPGVLRTIWNHRGVLARLGGATAALSAIRTARHVTIPIWGVSIGLDGSTIALIVGIGGAIDLVLFYTSGQIMDRMGRLWAIVPAMLLMGSGFIAMSFTHDLESSALWFMVFTWTIALGNAIASGVAMTLGADLAPQANPAPFLGAWRTIADTGGALSPLLFSAITAVSRIGIAFACVGFIAYLGAIGFVRWVPRYVSWRPRGK